MAHAELTAWAATCLGDIQSAEEVVSTPFSLVLKLATAKGVYYLKQTPPALYIEATTLDLLTRVCKVDTTPKLVAKNDALRCFITNSCGDETLRTFFNGKLDRELLCAGVACYAAVQVATAAHIPAFIKAGVPDWRLNNLSAVYDGIFTDAGFVSFLELSADDIAKMKPRRELLTRLCNELAAHNIPDTVNHSDFQNNNILIDHASKRLTIIDWGEIYVGNPLLSWHHCLMSASYVYQLDKNSDDFTFLEKHFFAVPEKIRDIVGKLYPVLYTLTWQQLVNATGASFPRKRELVRKTLLSFGEGMS